MCFLNKNRLFDFTYGERSFWEYDFEFSQTETDNTIITEYTLDDGLKVTNILTKYDDAYEWVNWFENTSDKPTKIISNLCDSSVVLPMPEEKPLGKSAYIPAFDKHTVVYNPKGSTCEFDEFSSFPDRQSKNKYEGQLLFGTAKKYSAFGGRSSDGRAPFFNVHKDKKGYIIAIGWTGQWFCEVSRGENDITVKSGVEDAEFYLLPNEKIRTSSFVVMPYEGSVVESQNKWRSLVRKHFSRIGKNGCDSHGPLCASVWGGMKTKSVLERIKTIKEENLPFEYIWMDAGWYGIDTEPTLDEFGGDWSTRVGDWRVSRLIHPNGLRDVADAIHKAGMKFLLWFEPERAIVNTPMTLSHPEYFITPVEQDSKKWLLDLGNEDAWQYCFDTVSSMIEDIGIDGYRQDFNFSPLPYWRKKDAENRKGITEIKHIMGLYRFWDALIEKFPNLLIDNCASGGRRIDIETLRRSIPLWRSDHQCPANYIPQSAQCHSLSFNSWLPYSGTGSGVRCDTYVLRSAYSPALSGGYFYSEKESLQDYENKIKWIRSGLEEYLSVRPYMQEDFYPLTSVSDRNDVWSALQFDRPSQNDGMVQIFRREESPYKTAEFSLYNIDRTSDYIFTDLDGTGEFTVSGEELCNNGLGVTIEQKPSAKIFLYRKK